MAWYDDVYIWTMIAVICSSAIIGLAYMLSKLFQLPVLEGWVKIELQELFASMAIAVFCVALIASANNAVQFLTGNPSSDIITAVRQNFLQNELYADGQRIYKNLVGAYFEITKVSSYSYSAGLSVGFVSVGMSSSPASGLSPLRTEIGQAIDGVANFMMLAASQSAFLLFFGNAAAIMLPVGIFLRSFSITRKVGGVVLAAVIASSVIYPASILLSKEIYDSFRPGMLSKANGIVVNPAPDPPSAEFVCSPYMKAFVQSPLPFIGGEMGWFLSFCYTIGWFVPFFCSPAFYDLIRIIYTIVVSFFPYVMYIYLLAGVASFEAGGWGSIAAGYLNPIRDYALPAVAQYSVLSLVAFLIPVIIAVSLLKNLTILFGGEPQFYGLSRLV